MAHRYPFSVINPTDYYGRRVAVYYNLHYYVFSIKEGGKNGLLLTHAAICELTDVTFEVEMKGRLRAISQGRKNVHAYVVGILNSVSWDMLRVQDLQELFNQGYQRVTYNLDLEHLYFYYKDAAEYTPVMSAKSVILYDKVALTL
ncbi:MAG: hypothetical protein KME29_08725 [Calothrix sp. FI2-JRJ7]|jgi:hypothetical protein|nr:hypothetical protein [Calothrix sp. FI2-JRJ7]